jgi:hypothetical protein
MRTELTIGKLAAAAGVNIETIRYYQRRGLLDEPPKPFGGQRRYPLAMAKRVRFIKRAQALGFTLSEIGALLRLDAACACTEPAPWPCASWRPLNKKLPTSPPYGKPWMVWCGSVIPATAMRPARSSMRWRGNDVQLGYTLT